MGGFVLFLQRYGEDLVCVCYHYDAITERRFTTVELIVEAGPWQKSQYRIPHNKTVRASGLTIRRRNSASSLGTQAANGMHKNGFGSWNMAKSNSLVSPNGL